MDKTVSLQKAMELIEPHDVILATTGPSLPLLLLDGLYDVRDRLHDITIGLGLTFDRTKLFLPECNDSVDIESYFLHDSERSAIKEGRKIKYIPVQLHNVYQYRRQMLKPNVLFAKATYPDENGYMSLGPSPEDTPDFMDMFDKVIIQVSPKMPYLLGESIKLHIDDVSCIVESQEECSEMPYVDSSKTDFEIASHIADLISDGACLQIGVGGVPNAVAKSLRVKKDMGIHTEMLAESMIDLIECGAINNSRKTLCPRKAVYGTALGSRRMYRYMDKNEVFEHRSFHWVNNPYVIAQNDNMVAINSAIAIDITGQVCAESIGNRQYSGTGGHLDFARGAQMSKNGKSFIVFASTYKKKDGNISSKIDFELPAGSVVTTPRTDVQYVATEYGIVNLRYQSSDYRARKLISIAHPDFRDELTFKAKKAGIII